MRHDWSNICIAMPENDSIWGDLRSNIWGRTRWTFSLQSDSEGASWLASFSCCYARKWYIPFDLDRSTKNHGNPDRMKFLHRWQVTLPIGFMWYSGQTIVIVEGLVGKTKHYACYKYSHIFLDLTWTFKVWKSEMPR